MGDLTCVSSACLERGNFDNDCCSQPQQASCKVGYTLVGGDVCAYTPGNLCQTSCCVTGTPTKTVKKCTMKDGSPTKCTHALRGLSTIFIIAGLIWSLIHLGLHIAAVGV